MLFYGCTNTTDSWPRYIGLVTTNLTSQRGRAIKASNASKSSFQHPVRYARYNGAVVQPCLGSRVSGQTGNPRRIRLVSSGGNLWNSGSKTSSFKWPVLRSRYPIGPLILLVGHDLLRKRPVKETSPTIFEQSHFIVRGFSVTEITFPRKCTKKI